MQFKGCFKELSTEIIKKKISSVLAEMIKKDIMSPGLLLFWTEVEQYQKEEKKHKGH